MPANESEQKNDEQWVWLCTTEDCEAVSQQEFSDAFTARRAGREHIRDNHCHVHHSFSIATLGEPIIMSETDQNHARRVDECQ